MAIQPCMQSQYRTLHHLYLFKEKSPSAIVVKMYNITQKCLSKKTVSATELGASTLKSTLENPSALWSILLQKKLIDEETTFHPLFLPSKTA